jgi:hypothetical protein
MIDHRADYTQKPVALGCPAGSDHNRECPRSTCWLTLRASADYFP